jgi:hypothetical protein
MLICQKARRNGLDMQPGPAALDFSTHAPVHGSDSQELYQPIFSVKLRQIVISADVGIADIDLGNGASAGFLYHFSALHRLKIHANFFYLRHSPRKQQAFGHNAIGAKSGGVHDYLYH